MKKFSISILLLGFTLTTGCFESIENVMPDSSIAVPETLDSMLENESEPSKLISVNSKPPKELILEGMEHIEVYEKVTVGDFIRETNAKLLNENDILDTGKTGKSEVLVKFDYNGSIYEKKLSYEVSDTTPPLLLSSGDGTVIKVGTAFDLNDHIGFCDNYDRTPKLTYDGSIDANIAGDYPLTATITDSAGNKTSWDLTITVSNEIPCAEDEGEGLPFEVFAERYGGEGKRLGIDVSRWQGDIDFKAVKNAGCSFVILRIGTYYDEDSISVDSRFETYFADAKSAGLDIGVYFYSTANDTKTIKATAEWINKRLDGYKTALPVVFDWENFYEFQKYKMNIHDLNEHFMTFADEMSKYGYKAMLYSSKIFLEDFWEEQIAYPVWLAHYTDETNYTGDYAMWQVTSHGSISGIDGYVDFNILYDDKF